jgi:hypothetical protein
MSEITIRKVENGYVIDHDCPPYEERETYVAKTDRDMIDHVTEFFFGGVLDIAEAPSPEQPSEETMVEPAKVLDTSSLGPMKTAEEFIEGAPAPLPVEPMADLSGSADEVLASNGVYDVGDRTYAFGAEISNGSAETD